MSDEHAIASAIIRLMQGVVYRESDEDTWLTLERSGAGVRDHFATIGVDVVVDDAEGYAYLRSRPEEEGEEALPRLVRRRALTYNVSLLLVLLRKRLVEFETTGGDGRMVLTTEQIVEMLRLFQAESTNDARVVDQAEATIKKAAELGFLQAAARPKRPLGGAADPQGLRRRPDTVGLRCEAAGVRGSGGQMSEGSSPRLSSGAGRAGYRLQHLEVLNWGTFDAQVWRFTPGAETALLTGDIGSGKSTLVDALTTLLMPAHKVAYNKAAGADAKERTLRSYVEGHYKSERIEATGRSRAKGLREDRRTYSVVLGVFTNHGYNETVTLAQVFQQRESTGQPYRFFVTATKELSITTDFADFGSDLRDLRKRLRAAGAEIFDEFPKYATSLRRLLGIRSEQALELFHQTVSMKSVGNLNEFVRDHMLEPSDSSERVRDIIAHFDDLTKAHDAVKRAREQLEALEPIVQTAAKYDAALAERDGVERERAAVRLFIAELRSRLLADEIAGWRPRDRSVVRAGCRKSQAAGASGERDSLIEERAKAGGDRIGELERLARDARAQAEKRRRSADALRHRCRRCRAGADQQQRGVRGADGARRRRAAAAG